MPTRRGANLLCSVFGFCIFPGAYAARLSFLTVLTSSPESKLAEEGTREKEISRECRGPLTAFPTRLRDRPRVSMRVFLCRCVRMRRRLHSCSCAYNMPRIYAERPRRSRVFMRGTNDFSACSSHEWTPRRVGFTDTSAAPLRSDAPLHPVIDFADAWRRIADP